MCHETPPPRSSSICVIFNPAAGRSSGATAARGDGRGLARAGRAVADRASGHALELARRAAANGFEIVAAAGGDGTVHEVANGVLQAGRPEVCFAVIPLGSANDYAHSLVYPHDGTCVDPGRQRRVDVGRVRTVTASNAISCAVSALGLSACVTVESQQIHRLQGQLLYGLAALKAMWGRWSYLDLTGTIDGEPLRRARPCHQRVARPTRRGFRDGPHARLDDGWFDCVQAGTLTRWEALRMIPGISASGPPRDHPKLHLRRVPPPGDRIRPRPGHSHRRRSVCRPGGSGRHVEIELIPAGCSCGTGSTGLRTDFQSGGPD